MSDYDQRNHDFSKAMTDAQLSYIEAEIRVVDLKAENTKLRELVRMYGEYTDQDRCEGCVCKSRCNDGDIEECWQLTEIRNEAHKLGIEVGEQ